MVQIAFYKAPGNLVDKTIRWGSNSIYSHVEIIGPDGYGWSSSQRDGGVRSKKIDFESGSWDILDVAWVDARSAVMKVHPHLGKKYDYAAILLSHVLATERHAKGRWICSELVAHCLGLPNPHTLSPGRLYDMLLYMGERVNAR